VFPKQGITTENVTAIDIMSVAAGILRRMTTTVKPEKRVVLRVRIFTAAS
jgi:hypothetical protein